MGGVSFVWLERRTATTAHVCDATPPRRLQFIAKHSVHREFTSITVRAVLQEFTMLLLDYQNVLLQSVLTERFSGYVVPSVASQPANVV